MTHGQPDYHGLEIAVIGMAGRFPGAADLTQFHHNLANGVCSITDYDRETLSKAGVDPALLNHPDYVRSGGYLPDADAFDAEFFGFGPQDAALMDPQHRIFLECAWQAFEDAGLDVTQCGRNTGVYAGHGMSLYSGKTITRYFQTHVRPHQALVDALAHPRAIIANEKDYFTTRVSYKLGLTGPSYNLQTACSTSLVAVHVAAQALLSGECDLALAGGAAVPIPLKTGYLHLEGGIFSPDGRCRAFDHRAQGLVGGSGVGAVVLKRLEDARLDGDPIYAVIKGSAVNNDGKLKVSYMAPSIDGQVAAIRAALQAADVDPATIGLLEAHGTGTALGDAIEVAGLTRAYREYTQQRNYCMLGSVKTNIGHLDTAAGIAGFIKAVLAVHHKVLPPTLHIETPNPNLELDQSPFYLSSQAKTWPDNGNPRRAGISAFGAGGTNAHVLIEQAPPRPARKADPAEPVTVLLTAKTPDALADMAERYAAYLAMTTDELRDIAHTTATGRTRFVHRLAVSGGSREELKARFLAYQASGSGPDIAVGKVVPGSSPTPIAFLFSGQGSQYSGMGRELYSAEPVFRHSIDTCAAHLDDHLERPLKEILFGMDDGLIHATQATQPALFALEVALARLWISRGIQPTALLGHSVGQYAAAHIAGVFSLEEGCRLIAARGRLMGALPAGGLMAAVMCSAAELPTDLAAQGVAIAAYNGPQSLVLSGAAEKITPVLNTLAERGIAVRKLVVSHAFHSELMHPMREAFRQTVQTVRFQRPSIELVADTYGTKADADIASADYWVNHIHEPIRFAQGVSTLADMGCTTMVEIGPGSSALSMARKCLDDTHDFAGVPSLHPKVADLVQRARAHGLLLVRGLEPKGPWSDETTQARRIPLPLYPFRKTRCWIEAPPPSRTATVLVAEGNRKGLHDLLQTRTQLETAALDAVLDALLKSDTPPQSAAVETHCFEKSWVAATPLAADPPKTGTLLVVGASDSATTAARCLAEQGFEVIQQPHTTASLPFTQTNRPSTLHAVLNIVDPVRHDGNPAVDAHRVATFPEFLRSVLGLGFTPIWWTITLGARAVGSTLGTAGLAQATWLGVAGTLQTEHPELSGRMADLDPGDLGGSLSLLSRDLLRPDCEPILAYRGRQRLVPKLKTYDLLAAPTPIYQPEATYLITGGLGRLGRALGEHFIEQGVRHLLLLSRRTPDAETRQWLEGLQAGGARVHLVRGDAAVPADLDRVFDLLATLPPLAGVVHTAGLTDDGVLIRLDEQRFRTVLAPKTTAAQLLSERTWNRPLDFFVMFSSLASWFGMPGQANYAAANAYLDALATFRREHGRPATAIAWGPWADIGMAAQVNLAARGVTPMPPALGLTLFDQIRATDVARVAVIPLPPGENLAGMGLSEAAAQIIHGTQTTENQPNQTNRPSFLEQRDPTTFRNELHDWLEAHIAQTVGLDPGTFSEHTGFGDLGIDSLMGLQLRSQLNEALGIKLSTTVLFKYACLADLELHLAEQLAPTPAQTNLVAASPLEPDTTEDVAALLAAELGLDTDVL